MFQKIFGVLLISVLTGCASTAPDARSVVIASEAKTSMVDFRNIREYQGNVTCGSYQVTSKWGESDGFRDFLVVGGQLKQRPNQQETTVFCTDHPKEAFEKEFGISPADNNNKGLQKFRKDLNTLELALSEYKADRGKFPTADQGLLALVLDSDTETTDKYRQGGYLNELPTDFWGRDYLYEPTRWGGVKLDYTIQTLGADGLRGGTGQNADISRKLIGYLEHLDSI